MTNTITVPTKEIAAVAKWAAPTMDRPHLALVVWRSGEYIACDGERLVRVPCETSGALFGVSRRYLLAAVAAQRDLKSSNELTLRQVGDTISIGIGDGLQMIVPSGNVRDYPDTATIDKLSVTSDSPSPDGYVMDPRLLAAVQEVSEATVTHGNRGVRIISWGGANEKGERLDAMTMRNAAGVTFVLMPMMARGAL